MKKLITLSLILLVGTTSISAQNDDYDFDSWVMYLADTMKNSLLYDNGKLVDTLFNAEIFAEKVFVKKENDSLIQTFNELYFKKEFQNIQFGNSFSKEIENTYYDYVNHYTSIHNDDLHILFRLVGDEGGMNYHDFQLRYSTQDSSYQVIDVFLYSIGVDFSAMLSEFYKNELREWLNNKNKIFKSSEVSDGLKLTRDINKLVKNEEYQKALDIYHKIPADMQAQKTYRYIEIKILAGLDLDRYIKAVEAYENDYPKDPSIYLNSMYKFINEENYDMALKYLNKLDIKLGLDPFLNFERGNIYYLNKDYPNAQKYYEKAFKDFYYEDLYFVMVQFYYETEQIEKIIPILDAIIKDLKYLKEDIITFVEEEYKLLGDSDQYQEWKKVK